MYLKELNKSFSELDRKIIQYIKKVTSQMLCQAKEQALLTCKYKIGFEFNHPVYGLGFIRDIEINLNKESFMSFDTDITMLEEDYYKPFYTYIVDYYTGNDVYGHHVTDTQIDNWINNE
jgi:hypothetical protein